MDGTGTLSILSAVGDNASKGLVRLSPVRMGPLCKHPALPSTSTPSSSRMCSHPRTLQTTMPLGAEAVFCYLAENSHHLEAQVTSKNPQFQEEKISERRKARSQVT